MHTFLKGRKNSRFQKYLDACGRGLGYTLCFQKETESFAKTSGIVNRDREKKTKNKKQNKKKTMPETVLYTGHFSAPVSFSVLRFALASAVNTGIHSGQTVMQVNGQLVLYILYIGAILSRVSIENETGVERETPTRLSPALRTYVLT